MGFAIRIPDEPYVWLQRLHVDEGQSIAPGADIADVMYPDGVVRTLTAECWGIVAHVEKGLIDTMSSNHVEGAANDDAFDDDEDTQHRIKRRGGSDGRVFSLFKRGDIICHIARRDGIGNRDGKLHPRQAPALRRARLGITL